MVAEQYQVASNAVCLKTARRRRTQQDAADRRKTPPDATDPMKNVKRNTA